MVKLTKDKSDIFKLIISTVVGLLIITMIALSYFGTVKDHLIENEQNQLLTLSKTVAKSIEQFFNNHTESLTIVINNGLFKEQFQYYKAEDQKFVKFDTLAEYYLSNKDSIEAIEIYNTDLYLIDMYPSVGDVTSKISEMDLKFMQQSKDSLISDLYRYNNSFYIDLYVPYINQDKHVEAIICARIPIEKIYDKYVKPIRVGTKGYASVKDQNGVLIMHPKKEDIGVDVIKARKTEFPDYDWSELEKLVEIQKQGESGVGTYHSIWYHDEQRERVKKINAYAPAVVGNKFWIVNVSTDYLEMTNFLRNSTIKSIVLSSFIILIFLAAMIYIYKIKKDKRQLEVEASYSRTLNQLNKELEKDLEEKNELQESLQQSVTKYEKLFNSASDCIFVMNLDEKCFPSYLYEVNDKAIERLKYSKKALLSCYYSDISKLMTKQKLKDIISRLQVEKVFIFEDILLTQDKKEIPVEISAHLYEIFNEKKVLMISRDISLRKMQEMTLKRSQERFRALVKMVADEIGIESTAIIDNFDEKEQFILAIEKINIELEKLFKKEVQENQRKEALMIYQSRLAAMGEMIANIAHQWRQPLSALSMIQSNLLDAYETDDLTYSYMSQKIQRSQTLINHMSTTIDDFRNFFNPVNQDVRFNLGELIEQTLRFLEDVIRLNNIEIILSVDNMIFLEGYANQFLQVIFSVLQNGVDAIVENNVKGVIEITAYKEDGNAFLKIKDNGGGIPEAIKQKIFSAYFTTKQKEKGTGLGLYMSKTVIEKSFNGQIRLQSSLGETELTILVPMGEMFDEND